MVVVSRGDVYTESCLAGVDTVPVQGWSVVEREQAVVELEAAAMLCVRISSSVLNCARALLTVEGEGLGTCYIALLACVRARRTVSHTPRSHPFVAEALGNPPP